MKEKNGFYKFILPLENNLFKELSNDIDFGDIAKGRKGNNLVKISEKGIPIIRTTTQYTKPAHIFLPIHTLIAECIAYEFAKFDKKHILDFNNALIEIYDHTYTKMKYHSDQCLDMADNSFIALFSCYEQPDNTENQLRKLKIKHKNQEFEEFEFLLEHNSVILFSLKTNINYLHQIILETPTILKNPTNKWLGITFRQSNTFIQFKNNVPYFPNGNPLQLADEIQSKQFYVLRTQENNNIDFIYPNIDYTLSMSDMLMPK